MSDFGRPANSGDVFNWLMGFDTRNNSFTGGLPSGRMWNSFSPWMPGGSSGMTAGMWNSGGFSGNAGANKAVRHRWETVHCDRMIWVRTWASTYTEFGVPTGGHWTFMPETQIIRKRVPIEGSRNWIGAGVVNDMIGLLAHGVEFNANWATIGMSIENSRLPRTVAGFARIVGGLATGVNVGIVAITVASALQNDNATVSTWVNVGVVGGTTGVAIVGGILGAKVVVPVALGVGVVWGVSQAFGGDAINTWIDSNFGNNRW